MRTKKAYRVIGIGVMALGIALAGAFGLRALGSRPTDKASGERPLMAVIQAKQVNGQTRLLVPKDALTAGATGVTQVRNEVPCPSP